MSTARMLRRLLTWNSRARAVERGRVGSYAKRAATYRVLGKVLGRAFK